MVETRFDGEQYAKASTHQKLWGSQLIAELALRGDERILDLGCGDGVLTAALAERVPRGEVVGIDAAPSMLDKARKTFGHVENLRFERMAMEDLDFHDEFDVVFSNAAMHWVHDHARLLAAIRRALRPGGLVRLNFGGEGNCATLNRVLQDAMAESRFAPFFADFVWPWFMPGVEAYRETMAAAGFAESRVWSENADRFFPDAEVMIRWIDQPCLVPFLPCLPEADRPAFRDAVIENMIAACRQEDGRCFETFTRLNVLARSNATNQKEPK
jgi:trans-aconitate methyltransferase